MFSYEQRLKVNSLPMYIYNILHTPYIYPTSTIQLSQMGKKRKKSRKPSFNKNHE